MATVSLIIQSSCVPSVKSFNAAYISVSSFVCRVRRLGRAFGRCDLDDIPEAMNVHFSCVSTPFPFLKGEEALPRSKDHHTNSSQD